MSVAWYVFPPPQTISSKKKSKYAEFNVQCLYQNMNQYFDILLTLHLSIFILVINQPDAQNLFYNMFISCLYMFRTLCAHRQEDKIVLYSIWYHQTETSEWSKITKRTKITKIHKYEHIVIRFMCEFFGCDYCVLLTININFPHKFYYYVLIFICFNNFSYFRPLTCFSVMITEAV